MLTLGRYYDDIIDVIHISQTSNDALQAELGLNPLLPAESVPTVYFAVRHSSVIPCANPHRKIF